MSNVRNPKERSDKDCVCGGHSAGARKRRRPWRRIRGKRIWQTLGYSVGFE